MVPAEDGAEEEAAEGAAEAEIVWKDGWRGPQRSEDEAPLYKYPYAVMPDKISGQIEPVPLGGTRCPDTDVCVTVPRANESEPLASPFGFACCPRSGYKLSIITGESWNVYKPEDNANLSTGDLNYTCVPKEGDSLTNALAEDAVTIPGGTVQASIARSATLASGCIHNMSTVSDVALDDCVLKTCGVVCQDVVRKCPTKLAFSCPADFREYEATMCNVMVPQGCLLKVEDEATGAVNCVDLNPTGYGPMFYTSKEQDDWKKEEVFKSSGGTWHQDPVSIYGLPAEPSCRGVNGLR
jgi:hypothetical protein